MEFKRFETEDFQTANRFFQLQNSRLSDFSCGAIFMWSEYLGTQYCLDGNTLYIRFMDRRYDHNVYAYPVTSGAIEQAIENLEGKISSEHPLVLVATPEEKLQELNARYEIDYHFKRDWSDYLYDAAQFREMKGKKFHGKRNHIAKYIRLYGAPALEEIDASNLPEVFAFLEHYHKNGQSTKMSDYEYRKNFDALANMGHLNMRGFLLRAEGSIAAISAGELLGDTLFVHIEKASRDFEGAYTVIANAFAKQFPQAAFINREDDAGDEGLRKSKLSYNPVRLLNKYVVRITGKKRQ